MFPQRFNATYWSIWDYSGKATFALDDDNRWRWVDSFKFWLLYFQRKGPGYSLHMRVSRAHSQSGCGGKETSPCPFWGQNPQRSKLKSVTILRKLSRLRK
jgi:hypothetical protein